MLSELGRVELSGATKAGLVSRLPAGAALGVFFPGLPFWLDGEKTRALILGGGVASLLAAAVLVWGSPIAPVFALGAFAVHVYAVAEAIRRRAFPPHAPWVPWLASAAAVSSLFYAPALFVASALALPVFPRGFSDQGFAVNRWAYRGGLDPGKGDLVLLSDAGIPGPWLGKVIAAAGEHVIYPSPERLRPLGGDEAMPRVGRPGGTGWVVREFDMEVPRGYALVAVIQGTAKIDPQARAERLFLVSSESLLGKAWTTIAPLSRRKLFLWASR